MPAIGELLTPGFVLRGAGTMKRLDPAAATAAHFVTLSTCLAECAPASWVSASWSRDPGEREAAARLSGCEGRQVVELQAWVERHLEEGALEWPDVFRDVTVAREFARMLPRPPRDLMLLGIGLRPADGPRYAEESVMQAPQRVLRPLPSGGELLGWEPVTASGVPHDHSWRCNGIDVDAREKLGVHPNVHGLVADEEDARRIADLCDSGEWPSEPEPWFAMAVVRYPLGA